MQNWVNKSLVPLKITKGLIAIGTQMFLNTQRYIRSFCPLPLSNAPSALETDQLAGRDEGLAGDEV